MKKFLTIFLFTLLFSLNAHAALPFVTDDAAIADPNQLMVEAFSEIWNLPKKADNSGATLSGNYLGLSYGTKKNLEISVGGLAGYDFSANSAVFMNPIIQMKTVAFKPQTKSLPQIALSLGYANKNGKGQYYDQANNAYFLAAATQKFFNDRLTIHVNIGPKASFNTAIGENSYRLQLGIAADMALVRRDLRLIVESFNGAPNSPRDSSGYFHSYQIGFRWLKSDNLAFHILYGKQPTFMGYEGNQLTFRNSDWVQVGIRKSVDNLF